MDVSRDFKKLFVGGPEGTFIIKLSEDPEIEAFYDSKRSNIRTETDYL
jgi:hypothetical protein